MATNPQNCQELDSLLSEPDESTIESIRMSSGDFAVLGASGKMGYHLCRMLTRCIHSIGSQQEVHAVSRFNSVRSREDFENLGCQVHPADLSHHTQLGQLPDTCNIFFLAGVKFGTANDTALLQKMNVEMPRMVAEKFQNSKIVALSTGCVYSFTTPESGGSVETDATDPPGEYARSCLGREDAFVDAAQKYGTKSALIRLNYSIDLRYGVLHDLAKNILSSHPIDLSMGYVNLIWQADALRHILRSLGYVTAPPEILNITGSEVLKVRDLATALGHRLDKTPVFTGQESLSAWLNNPKKSHRIFGKPATPIHAMLDMVAEWTKAGRESLGKPTHFQTRDGQY
jgi:nucleoside-diphosphate-sugar epimerase